MDRMKRIQAAMLAFVMVAVCVSVIGAGDSDADWYNETDVSFKISTAEQLAGLAQLVNGGNTFEGKTVKLTKDIALSGEWTPIGNGTTNDYGVAIGNKFKGTFDGGDHTVSGLRISSGSSDEAIGLFGIVAAGTVENVILTEVSIRAASNDLAGAIAGMICEGGSVVSCVVGSQDDGSIVEAMKGNGGIVGKMYYSGSIINCENFAEIKALKGTKAGGIVAGAYCTAEGEVMTIEGCTNYANVNGSGYIGGIVGLSTAFVKDCVNVGDVTSNGNTGIGGIVGEQKNYGAVSNCTNFGTVTNNAGTTGEGGIVGWVRYSTEDGYFVWNMIEITGNINLGDVVGVGGDAGGIVGLFYNWGYVANNINLAGKISSSNFATGILTYQDIGTVIDGHKDDLTLEGNVSITKRENITGGCATEFVWDNTGGTIKGTPSTDKLPSGFVIPTEPVPTSPSEVPKKVESENETASIVIVTIKNGECNSGVVSVEITVSTEPVVKEAVKTYDVTISRVVSSNITITFYDVDIPSGKVPKVFSYKDGSTVEEKVVSYTSSSVTIQTDHNTPFSIVIEDSPIIYDDDDYDYIPPYVAPTNTDNDDDDSKKMLACAAAAVVAALMAAFLVIDKKR